MIQKISIAEKFAGLPEFLKPRIVAEVNDVYVKIARFRGEFVWHRHEAEDELFYVVKGRLRMQLRDGARDLSEGELIVVPRGVEHCPLALSEEVLLLLVEPKTTVNTGNVRNEITVADEWI